MNNIKFTPGPWKIDKEWHLHKEDEYCQIIAGDGTLPEGFTLSGLMTSADARLIEAAPEMYDELVKTVQELNLDKERSDRIYQLLTRITTTHE